MRCATVLLLLTPVFAGDLGELAKRLEQGSVEERKAVLAEVAKQGGLDAARLVLSRADDPDLRIAAAEALSTMTDAETLAWLRDRGLAFPSAPIRACVARALLLAAQRAGQPVPDAVAALAKDPDPEVREAVAEGPGAHELLHDPAWQVRLAAYRTVARDPSPEAAKLLAQAAGDADLTIQREGEQLLLRHPAAASVQETAPGFDAMADLLPKTVDAAARLSLAWRCVPKEEAQAKRLEGLLAKETDPRVQDGLRARLRAWKPRASEAKPFPAPLAGRAGERKGGEADAIRAACVWLARHQEADGRWSCAKNNPWSGGIPFPDFVEEDRYVDAAVTGLAVLVILGDGGLPDGDFGGVARRGLDYLVRCQGPDGRIDSAPPWAPSLPGAPSASDPNPHPKDASNFNHTIGTLALVEACALWGDKALAEPAQKALDHIAAGEVSGNLPWGPYLRGEDTAPSVFTLQAMALAQHAGLRIAPDGIALAKQYVEQLTDVDSGQARFHHVMPYCLGGYDGTATLLASRAFLGMSLDDDTAKAGLAFLLPHRPNWNAHFLVPKTRPRSPADRWRNPDDILNFWYFRFASEVWRAKGGAEWDRWWKDLCGVLLPAQRRLGDEEGSWDPEGAWARVGGRVYSTCFCALALETPYAYDFSRLR